ncbi:MAG TPA: hypothetical protein VGQ83_18940 [Polyangia bacterium]|jgi:hypothetical protein
MRVLEARFYPDKRPSERFLVVGRVFCDGRRAVVAPVLAPGSPDPGLPARLTKLNYLVHSAGWRPYKRLVTLESEYWSFVEIPEGMEGGVPC